MEQVALVKSGVFGTRALGNLSPVSLCVTQCQLSNSSVPRCPVHKIKVMTVGNPSFTPGSKEDPLEKGMATHPHILAWKIPLTETLAGNGPWGCKESGMTERLTLTD